jgi:hypothetical protein
MRLPVVDDAREFLDAPPLGALIFLRAHADRP